jgi:hypothetical protein
VYDTDFVDSALNPLGHDQQFFDRGGRAVAYFTGHGIRDDGCSIFDALFAPALKSISGERLVMPRPAYE